MAEFISLTCSSCGGKLQIPVGVEQFACGYCSTEFTVNRGGGIVSLAPLVDGIQHVQRGVDKTASELAIVRLQREIEILAERFERQRAVESKPSRATTNVGFFFLIAGAVLVLAREPMGGGILAIVGVLCLIAAHYSNTKKPSELDAIEQQLATKRAELERHKAIVNR